MNRKQILSSATIAVFAGILLTWAPTAAYGGGGFQSPATVEEGWGCFVTSAIGGPGFTTDTHSVINKNFTKITCHFTGLTPQDPALIFRGRLAAKEIRKWWGMIDRGARSSRCNMASPCPRTSTPSSKRPVTTATVRKCKGPNFDSMRES